MFWPCRDRAVLADGRTPILSKAETVVSRLIALRLCLPSEMAWRQIVGASLAAGLPCESAASSFHMLGEMKRILKQKVRGTQQGSEMLKDYPANPDLPGWLLSEAYLPDDQPLDPELVDEACVAARSNQVALRRTSKRLRATESGTGMDLALTTPQGGGQFINFMGQFMHFMQQQQQQQQAPQTQQHPSSSSAYLSNLKIFALRDTKIAARHVPEQDNMETPSPRTKPFTAGSSEGESMSERATVMEEALKQREAEKKAAGPKAKAKAKAAATAKAKAKAKSAKFFSGGCGKCRRTPGCFPSCFKYRGK